MFLSVKKSSLARFLEQAILSDERRNSFIYKALHTYIQHEDLVSTAFIWLDEHKGRYEIVVAGLEEGDIFQWLQEEVVRLLDIPLLLQENSSPLRAYNRSVFPIVYHKQITGYWIVWAHDLIHQEDDHVAFILPYLEVITAIHQPQQITVNQDFLHDDLIEAFQHKDPQAIIAILSILRITADANLVYWGDIVDQTISITSHLGAHYRNFGFELSVGKGFGGKAAHRKNMLTVTDYQHSPYRVREVSDIIDREGLRSGIVLPIKDKHVQVSGLLYVTRRKVQPFSLLQQMSLLRIAQSIEPLRYQPAKTNSFFMSNSTSYSLASRRKELRTLTEQEKDLSKIEKWAANILRGNFIVVDRYGTPYNSTRGDFSQTDGLIEVPFYSANGRVLGTIFYSTPIHLEQCDWPDIIDDLTMSCRIVLERQGLLQRGDTYKYTVWLTDLLQKGMTENLYYEGLQLGLPINKGETWLLKWENQDHMSHQLQGRFNRLTLKMTKRRLIFFEGFDPNLTRRPGQKNTKITDEKSVEGFSSLAKESSFFTTKISDMTRVRKNVKGQDLVYRKGLSSMSEAADVRGIYAVLIFDDNDPSIDPHLLRNELLKMYPSKLWLVQGATFNSFSELKEAIKKTLQALQEPEVKQTSSFVVKVEQIGLDHLFNYKGTREKLHEFSLKLLDPLLTYDAENKTNFTETFVYHCLLPSPDIVAEKLFIHKNTVLYRVRRAEEILQMNPKIPGNRVAVQLAAYQWMKENNPNLLHYIQ